MKNKEYIINPSALSYLCNHFYYLKQNYDLQNQSISAGITSTLDGIEKKRNPGKPIYLNMYEESHKVKGAKKLPSSLEKALKHLTNNKVLNSAFGKSVINSYIKLKNKEIKRLYHRFLELVRCWR